MAKFCGTECEIIKKPLNEEKRTKVFVCGGGSDVASILYQDAQIVGELLAKKNTVYVQGGCIKPQSMMGASYFGYKNAGGTGAYFIMRKEGKPDISSEISNLAGIFDVVDINDLCRLQFLWPDIIVIMPGGTGTICELTSHLEQMWDYENVKRPIIILYNKLIDGKKHFFDPILEQLSLSAKYGFNKKNIVEKSLDHIVDNVDDLLLVITQAINQIESVGTRKQVR